MWGATVIVSVFVLMISAKPELELEELDELEPPRLPAVTPEPDPEDELDDDPLEDEDPLEPLPDTASPGLKLDSDAIVPLTGA